MLEKLKKINEESFFCFENERSSKSDDAINLETRVRS